MQRFPWCELYQVISREQLFKQVNNLLPGNPERVAVPLNGPGGRIAILELKKGGRLPDGPLAAFFNTCKVLDFSWDPFNNRRLAVGRTKIFL